MSYCQTCGIRPPHHWAGCPEDHESVGLPARPPAVASDAPVGARQAAEVTA